MKHIAIALCVLITAFNLIMLPYSLASNTNEEGDERKDGVGIHIDDDIKDDTAKSKLETIYPRDEAKKKGSAEAGTMPVFKPPLRGAPVGRIAGGTRGILDEYPAILCVLSPDHTGLTIQEQPTFYWFLSEMVQDPVEFTFIKDRSIQPIIETRIALPKKPGIQCVRLSDYSVSLQLGVTYKWFIALVPDPDRRSKDILAWGEVERIEISKILSADLSNATEEMTPHIYAQAGLWYDAFSKLSDLLEDSPSDRCLREQRASLLEQVDLPEIARYDMETIHNR